MSNLSWSKNKARQRLRQVQSDERDTAAHLLDLDRARVAATLADPKPPKLTKPIVVSRFWRNQARECVVTTLEDFKGTPVINVRIWYTGRDGVLRPGKQGICLSVRCLPALSSAMTKALALAVELGVLPEGLTSE